MYQSPLTLPRAHRKDATLREVLTTLRATAPHVAEYRHPLARFSFRTVFADASNKGRFAQKELGMVYSRDILGEPGTLQATAPRLLLDIDPGLGPAVAAAGGDDTPAAPLGHNNRERERDTLDALRFVPGDFLLVSVLLPKNVTLPSELAIKGSSSGPTGAGALPAPTASWKTAATAGPGRTGDAGWGRAAPGAAVGGPGRDGGGRGGGHWRGGTEGGRGRGGGRGGGGDRDRDRDLDRDRDRDRVPPPRRSPSPLPARRGGGDGWGARGGRGGRGGDRDRRTPSRSRSRSPPRRRRYD